MAIEINTDNQNYVEYAKNNIANHPTYFTNLNQNKTIYNPLEATSKHWDETQRGLTGVGQAVIAVAAVAIAVGTGGIGSGVSGAMMTAADNHVGKSKVD